jgi:hypothetical protein
VDAGDMARPARARRHWSVTRTPGSAIFIEYPFLAAIAGALLLGLGRASRRRTALTVGWLWVLYALYETAMHRRWLCSGECNIRIDLLVIYPVLLVASVAAGISLLRGSKRHFQ